MLLYCIYIHQHTLYSHYISIDCIEHLKPNNTQMTHILSYSIVQRVSQPHTPKPPRRQREMVFRILVLTYYLLNMCVCAVACVYVCVTMSDVTGHRNDDVRIGVVVAGCYVITKLPLSVCSHRLV